MRKIQVRLETEQTTEEAEALSRLMPLVAALPDEHMAECQGKPAMFIVGYLTALDVEQDRAGTE